MLQTATETWETFVEEFSRLWRTERTGILYARTLYEDQGDTAASETALREVVAEIFADLVGIAGIEMHRRILGLAHVRELDGIADPDTRAPIEERCLRLGRDLVLNRRRIAGIGEVLDMARARERGTA
jgi:5-methylthioribose kinase